MGHHTSSFLPLSSHIEDSLRNPLESLGDLAFREWASDAKKCTILSSISLLQHLKAGGPNSPVRLLPVIWQGPPAETKSESNLGSSTD